MAYWYVWIVLVVLLVIFIYLYFSLRKKFSYLKTDYENLKFDYKSMYVKHGKHFESFVPFMEDYPGEKENTVFLGNPIDFISFDDDSIKFIEVKTGKSNLSEKQKMIKGLVENKKVKWYELKFEK
ncbi:MAG: Holliday junction resolvase-like protein [Nanoarchaeota archaeon]